MRTATIAPASVHETLARHMLADGYDMVLDLEKSRGPPLGRAQPTLFPRRVLVFRHAAVGLNHPISRTPGFGRS